MPARNLEELRAQLLFNNTVEVWLTLCRERGWAWRDAEGYEQFLVHLHQRGVPMQPAGIAHPIRELRPGHRLQNFTLKLDEVAIGAVRAFQLSR